MAFHHAPGATPLDPDEAIGLLPKHITTQEELNRWELRNIEVGERWALLQTRRDLLNEAFVRALHRNMFNMTWRWAGTFRQSNKNIGIDWSMVSVRLRDLLDNTRFQIEHHVFDVTETAVRFHHQLVWIHPFPNGNGRHARLMADLLLLRLGRSRLSWGGDAHARLKDAGDLRKRYLDALRAADQGQFQDLLAFALG